MRNLIRNSIEKWMISDRLARSRKSGPGSPELLNEKFDKELNREMNGFRQAARSRKSVPGCPKVVNKKFDKEVPREMDAFREASQIQEIWPCRPRGSK